MEETSVEGVDEESVEEDGEGVEGEEVEVEGEGESVDVEEVEVEGESVEGVEDGEDEDEEEEGEEEEAVACLTLFANCANSSCTLAGSVKFSIFLAISSNNCLYHQYKYYYNKISINIKYNKTDNNKLIITYVETSTLGPRETVLRKPNSFSARVSIASLSLHLFIERLARVNK